MAQTMEAQCDTLPRTLRKHFAVLVTDVCAQAATRASLRAGNAAAAAHTEEEGCPGDPPLPNTRANDTPATACSTQTCCSVQETPKRLLAFGSAIGCWPVYGSGSPYYRPFTSEFTSLVVAGVSPTTPEPHERHGKSVSGVGLDRCIHRGRRVATGWNVVETRRRSGYIEPVADSELL